MEQAADRLWKPEGATALAMLRGRGLEDETIRAARLGWTSRADGVPWTPPGIVLPWFDGDRLALVKIRPPDAWRQPFPQDRRPPKYIEAGRDRPALYVARPVQTGRPVVVAEGELDALLLAQETADWPCGVVTTGSASARPVVPVVALLSGAVPWLIATDSDQAGERCAAAWMELAPGRCRRIRPPGPGKDWTDAHEAGFNRIRYYLAPHLGPRPSWETLAAQRWATDSDPNADEPPNILADEPPPEPRDDWPPPVPCYG